MALEALPTPWLPPKPRLTPPQPLSAGLDGGHPASEANALPPPLGRAASYFGIREFPPLRLGLLRESAMPTLPRMARARSGWHSLAQMGAGLPGFAQAGTDWLRLALILRRLTHICRGWLRLAQVGSDSHRLAYAGQACPDWSRLASDWRRMAQTGAGWPRFAQLGTGWLRSAYISSGWPRLAQVSSGWHMLARACPC